MTTPLCCYCGEPELLDLFEIWGGHEFQIETCCYDRHEEVVAEMADDPEWAAQLLTRLGAAAYLGTPLRRLAITDDGFGQMLLDCELRIRPIAFHTARRFVADHHDHNRPLPIDRFRAGIWNGPTLLGVCIVGNPTTPTLQNTGLVEVRRLCLDRSIPKELRYKACSALYAWAADTAERKGWHKIITYTLESESGMSLRYVKPRWKCDGPASREGHSWADRGPGRDAGPTERKVRWSRVLRPRVPRPIQISLGIPRQARRSKQGIPHDLHRPRHPRHRAARPVSDHAGQMSLLRDG